MIIFRADGNPVIGSGHIMRCLSIANAAKKTGEACVFILSSGEFGDTILQFGHGVEILGSDYSDPVPQELLPALDKYGPAAVFVDSYSVTAEYMSVTHTLCHEKTAGSYILMTVA